MIELHDKELMAYRGQDTTLHFEELDLKKRVRELCELLQSVPNKINQAAQPKSGMPIDAKQIDRARELLNLIDRCVMRLTELEKQRNELKPLAWPKGRSA